MKTVLIIDDSNFMRILIKNIVSQLGLTVVGEAKDGKAGLEKYKKLKPDVVTMDLIMDEMEGFAALQQIINYNSDAVVFIVSALGGQKPFIEQAMALGAKEVLTKPLDLSKFNTCLKKYIGEQYSQEASSYDEVDQKTAWMRMFAKNPKLIEVFCRDAEKAVVKMRQTVQNGDMKSFSSVAHTMKSALANVQEQEASDMAMYLEAAGQCDNIDFVNANVENFIKSLEQIIIKRRIPVQPAEEAAEVKEDTAFLAEQLLIVKTACENYDDTVAYAAFDRLQTKPWKTETTAALEQIRDMLFLHSDFEAAAEQAGELSSRVR